MVCALSTIDVRSMCCVCVCVVCVRVLCARVLCACALCVRVLCARVLCACVVCACVCVCFVLLTVCSRTQWWGALLMPDGVTAATAVQAPQLYPRPLAHVGLSLSGFADVRTFW